MEDVVHAPDGGPQGVLVPDVSLDALDFEVPEPAGRARGPDEGPHPMAAPDKVLDQMGADEAAASRNERFQGAKTKMESMAVPEF